MTSLTDMSRRELYDLVWSKPMRVVAATIPMSDVGLKKFCSRRGIPVPPRGYWNKVRAGHRMPPRPPLPPDTRQNAEPKVRSAPKGKQPGVPEPGTATDRRRSRTKEEVRPGDGRKAPSTAKRDKRKRRRPRKPTEARYVMPIDRWDWDYSFGINNTKGLLRGMYLDHRHLIVQGRLMRPTEIAGTLVRLSFVPSDLRGESKLYAAPPTSIGSMWRDRETRAFSSVVSMPEDVLPSLISMLLAERLRYVVFVSAPLFRGQADLRHYRFEETIEPEDMPSKSTPS